MPIKFYVPLSSGLFVLFHISVIAKSAVVDQENSVSIVIAFQRAIKRRSRIKRVIYSEQ
ncbi:MAG: hypothetical protein IPL99_25510 [Candidatus Competibacteraceae bacterium]|nr:hypothetical protein [Candidatus Competibacteraceae bacterium]